MTWETQPDPINMVSSSGEIDVSTAEVVATSSTEGRTLAARFAEVYNVKDYGATGDGTTDDTAAILAAIAAAGANTKVRLPRGTYKVTSTLTIDEHRVHLYGDGPYATQILFAPTANDTCLELGAGASVLYQGSVSNMAFTSNDSTYTKIAIDLVDTSGYRLENIVVGGTVVVGSSQYWSGGTGSIGLRVRGREFGQVKNLYCFADRPTVIAGNPNSSIDIDHFHFQDLYLGANTTFHCVTVEDGVNLSNVEFDGANPWVGGAGGFYWNDTTTSQISNHLRLRGIRTEQGTDATAYSIRISHNHTLQNLHIEDCKLDTARRGVYLRKIQNTLCQLVDYGGTLEAFNFVGASAQLLTFQNCFFQTGSTATLTGFILYDSLPSQESNKPIPNHAVYIYQEAWQSTGHVRRIPVIATASLLAAGAAQDATICIEDAGAGDRNLIIYAGGQRFRIDGGANV